MQRLIAPYEYRHLRALGVTRIAGGGVAAAAGIVCLLYYAYGWAVFFLVIGALNLAGGYWYLTVARSRNQREALRPQS
jgi:O-antigen/teichoic acid export membrane protein